MKKSDDQFGESGGEVALMPSTEQNSVGLLSACNI